VGYYNIMIPVDDVGLDIKTFLHDTINWDNTKFEAARCPLDVGFIFINNSEKAIAIIKFVKPAGRNREHIFIMQ
jgi:hypothetical protein